MPIVPAESTSATPRPLRHATLSWDFTRACNLSCGHCSNADDRAAAGRDLALKDAVHMLSEFARSGGAGLHLLGGEPLLRKDFATTVHLARELGLAVSVTSNGWYHPDEEMTAWLLSHLTMLTISLDGHTAALNDAIRGPGSFVHAVATLREYRRVREATGGTTPLNISHVMCASNVGAVQGMIDLANELAVDILSLTYLKEYGNALQASAPKAPSPAELLAAMDAAASAALDSRTTVVLFEVPRRVQLDLVRRHGAAVQFGGDDYCDTAEGQLRVSSDGLVFPCFAGSKHHAKFAQTSAALDIRHTPLPVILDGEFFSAFTSDAHARLAETPWKICQGCEYFHRQECYPGCPYEPQNLKPLLCSVLAANAVGST